MKEAVTDAVGLPLPQWIERWPAGLRPRRIDADPRALRLLYVHPDRGWVRVWLAIQSDAGERRLSIGVSDADFTDAAAPRRLVAALEARLHSEGAAALHWIDDACARAGALQARARAVLREAATIVPAPGRAAASLALRVLRAGPRRLEALTGFDPDADPPTADASPAELAIRALLLALVGLPVDSIALAERAAERAVGARERRAIAGLLVLLGREDAAAACTLAGAREGRMEPSERARAAALVGRYDLATAVIEDPNTDDEARRRGIAALIAAGGLEEARALLERRVASSTPPAWCLAHHAELALWRLDHAEAGRRARELLERADADDDARTTAWRILGALATIRGDTEAALAALERASAGSDPATTRLWQARALLERGDLVGARAAVRPTGFADRLPWILWRARIDAVDRPSSPGHEGYQVELVLAELAGEAAVLEGRRDPAARVDLLRRMIARLGGNYSGRVSTLEAGRLIPCTLASPRERAVAAQEALLRRPLAEVVEGFDAEAARAPHAPFPRTYRSELSLWTGEYEAARRDFAGIWEEHRTRWGYVGHGAALSLLGRGDEARAAWDAGLERYDRLPAEATHAYAGDLAIDEGRLDDAIRDLEGACAATPTRLGAWVSLALARARAGDPSGADAALDRVRARAPGMVACVADSLGLDPQVGADAPAALMRLCAELRRAMAGNRASTIYTFRDPRGRLRVLRSLPPERWTAVIERLAPLAVEVLADEP
ncbi:MAG: hypothetical protein R3B09_10550 [Nannocystaceae bacterium]